MALSAGTIAAAVHGRLVAGDEDRYVTGFSIDSRTLAAGDLFFAIVARRDGHDFAAAASRRRAAGLVVSRPVSLGEENESFVVEVADTTAALQELARFVRRESGATVVAITGSAGKTTTKDTLAAFLGANYRVVKNTGNLNNHLGLPLSLLELRHGADVAVMELGMNHAGEIRTLVGVATPEVRIWTNVGEAHIGHFGSAAAIADAKAEILEQATADTLLVANADDSLVMARAAGFPGRTVTFGTSEGATVRAVDVEDLGLDGSRARLVTRFGERDLAVPLLGRGHLMNVVAAAATALEMGVSLDTIIEASARLQPSPRRGAVLKLPKGVTVIDDSYNSSPSALQRSLEAVARAWATRRLAVVGEMLELGELATALHEEWGCGAAGRRPVHDRRRAGAGAGRGGDRRRDGGRHRRALRDQRRGGAGRGGGGGARRRGARQGVARHAHRSGGGPAGGGLRLMLYHFLISFYPEISVLNVTRYITFRTAAASMTALVISLVMGPWLIRRLRDFQIGQVIRQEGPESHRAKAGTPTMGGLLILAAALVPTLLWADLTNVFIWIAVVTTAAFGGIGFLDDYLKITRRSSGGLAPRYKFGLQVLVGLAVGLVLMWLASHNLYNTRLIFPFFKQLIPDLGWFYVPFATFVLVAWSNAVNLTDGLDGLAISTFAVAAAAFTALAYVTGHRVFAEYLLLVRFEPAAELTIFCGALVGASLGFLWYNAHPAEIFMGDVGSLALGGAIATVAILIKQELLLVIVGGVFVLEAASVVIQVASFKLRGKRVFKMAPLHHHFELSGWEEPKVITRFLIVAILFALFSLTTLKLR
jgi:phospho-N-acetylmuramoyl-pentapeptide-transferase